MQALGGMVAGNPAQSYQQARVRGQAIDTGDAEAAGDAAFGRALTMLHQGSQAPPTVPPGQPSMPQVGQQMTPATFGGATVQPTPVPQSPSGPQMAGGATSPRPGMSPPMGAPQPMPGGPPQGAAPPMGGGSPSMGGQPQFGQPGGGMTWQQAIQAVQAANPGIEQNPRALARAVDHFMPIMNQQSLQQWREVQAQLRASSLDVREEQIRSREGIERERELGRGERFEAGETGRTERTRIQEGGRTQRAETAEAGREGRSQRSETGRQQRFEQRETRLQSKADFDQEFKRNSQALSQRRFQWAQDQATRKQQLDQEKQRLAETHRVIREHISATGAGDTKAVKDLDASYKQALKDLDSSFMGRGPNRDQKTGPGQEYEVNKVYPSPQGNFRYKGGDVADPKNWDKVE